MTLHVSIKLQGTRRKHLTYTPHTGWKQKFDPDYLVTARSHSSQAQKSTEIVYQHN